LQTTGEEGGTRSVPAFPRFGRDQDRSATVREWTAPLAEGHLVFSKVDHFENNTSFHHSEYQPACCSIHYTGRYDENQG
jgi:hypothetical protein